MHKPSSLFLIKCPKKSVEIAKTLKRFSVYSVLNRLTIVQKTIFEIIPDDFNLAWGWGIFDLRSALREFGIRRGLEFRGSGFSPAAGQKNGRSDL
jgi:hypothetical protein